MPSKRFQAALILLAAIAVADLVRAEVAPSERSAEATVEVPPIHVRAARVPGERDPHGPAWSDPAARESERALENPGFVTVVDIGGARGEARPMVELLAETVGVAVRSLGGLGGFSSVSVRGAPAAQTEILLDGVPVSRLFFTAADMASLDLAAFDRVEVHRGGVPVELGGAVLGGAVNLVTAVGPRGEEPRDHLEVSTGSFGIRGARMVRRDALLGGRLATTAALGYAGVAGDYRFFDDRGTPLNLADDRETERINNGYDQLDGVFRARYRVAHGSLELGERLSYKEQGVPGPTGAGAEQTSLTTGRSILDARFRRTGILGLPRLDLDLRGYLVLERLRWQDPRGEIGLSMQDDTFDTRSGAIAVTAGYLLATSQRLTAGVEGQLEGFAKDSTAASAMPQTVVVGGRRAVSVSLADEVVLGSAEELVVVPAFRVDLVETVTEPVAEAAAAPAVQLSRREAFFSPRVGARWRVTPAFSIKGNVGRYHRAPTLVELFGDRGYVIGNPALRAEEGTSGDLGLVVAPPRRLGLVDRLYAEAAFFASRPNNLIAVLPTPARVARARNLGDVRLSGHELALSARFFRALTVSGNYTFLDSAQRSNIVALDGRRLPGRPRHELYVRLDAAHRLGAARRAEIAAYADATLVAGNYLDEGNLEQVPARRLFGLGLKAAPSPDIVLSIEVKNIFNERVEEVQLARAVRPGQSAIPRAVADTLGYPLPGRAIYAGASYDF